MILGAEIAMLLLGIVALTTGKMTLTKQKVVRGLLARFLGIIMLMPLPLALFLGTLLATVAYGQRVDTDGFRWTVTGIEAASVIVCIIAVYVIGMPNASDKEAGRSSKDGFGKSVDEIGTAEAFPTSEARGQEQIRASLPSPGPLPPGSITTISEAVPANPVEEIRPASPPQGQPPVAAPGNALVWWLVGGTVFAVMGLFLVGLLAIGTLAYWAKSSAPDSSQDQFQPQDQFQQLRDAA